MVVSRKAFLSGFLGATLVLSAPQSADSFELNPKAVLGIDAEVGLDPETRALLGRLPKELRAEIVKAVNESFDRADKSVVLFMSELNKTVGAAIDDAACKAAAAANNVAQAFAGKIPLLGGKQTIVKDAFADFEATQEAASAGDKPTDYSIAYADLLARTVVSRCIVSQSAEAVAELDKLQAAVRPKWSVWTRLGKAECEDAQSCFAMLENKTREVVTEADGVDVDVVDADARLRQIKAPDSKVWHLFSASEFEDQFVEMFGIIDGLEVSKKFREASAEADLAEASQMLKDAQKLLRTARTRAAPPTNLEHLKVAARASKKAAKILPPLKQKISNAVETLPEIRAKADPIAAEVAKVDTGIKKVDVKIAGTRDRLERIRTTDLIGRKFPF